MTSSSEEKEISRLLQSFPRLSMEEDKQRDIIRQLRQDKALLEKRKGRTTSRKAIGGIAAFLAAVWLASPFLPPSQAPSPPGSQKTEGESRPAAGAAETDLVLTIDSQIQSYVEKALAQTHEAVRPKNVTVIVADPNSGEILGIGSRGKDESESRFDGAVKAMPDPGAAYQIVTLAAAIQEGKFDPREIYESGTYTDIPGEPIKDFNNGIGWGKITYLEGVLRSSNVAFAKLAHERLQRETMQQYLQRFGFGQKTGAGVADEEAGQLPKLDEPRQVALAATGLGGAVTPLQQVAAVGAIANGGKLMQPHLFKQAGAGENSRYMIRQVVSEETAEKVRDILDSVVNRVHGSGVGLRLAQEDYSVAGKPSVIEKTDQQGNATGKYVVSVIGFAPSDDPKVLVYIGVDEPQREWPEVLSWRKIVAEPFQQVLQNSLQHIQKR